MPQQPPIHAAAQPSDSGSGYPEPFAKRMGSAAWRSLGDPFGLTQFGVSLETLQPGAQSSVRHWHTLNDEWVYMVDGELVLRTNDGESTLTPGQCMGFAAGDKNAHQLVNRSTSAATFLVVGSRVKGDVPHYPDDDLAVFNTESGRVFVHKDGAPFVAQVTHGTAVTAASLPSPDEVLRFWFEETQPAQWWQADPAFDARIGQRFASLHRAVAQAEMDVWRATPAGRLAEVIVLDQFSRNLHRGQAQAFVCDAMALALAQQAVAAGADRLLPAPQRAFLYMPYMHSESRQVHKQSEQLFMALGAEGNLRAALQHKAIIDRFGRYPHRNVALGRVSSAQEEAFLLEPGSRF